MRQVPAISSASNAHQRPEPAAYVAFVPADIADMSPAIPQPNIVAQFRSLIWQALDTDTITTALFVAERLYAYDPKGADSVHLFALCLYRDGQYQAAENLTKGWFRHVGCAYVYAQCCLKLGGGKENEGVNALEGCKRQWGGSSAWSE